MAKLINSSSYQFTYKNFAAVLNKYQYHFNPGDIVAGTIFSIEQKGFLVDIGASVVGFLPLEELSLQKINHSWYSFLLDEIREFCILSYDQTSRQILLSVKKADYIKAWHRIKQIYLENIVIDAKVLKYNKGGTIVEIDGLKGFVPISHMIRMSVDKIGSQKNIPVKVLEIDERLNYMLLSYRCAYIQKNQHIFALGNIIIGTIYLVRTYGVLLYIDKVQGLLHISEIAKKKNQSIEKMFSIGEKIEAMIIHIDVNKGRITLSQKALIDKGK